MIETIMAVLIVKMDPATECKFNTTGNREVFTQRCEGDANDIHAFSGCYCHSPRWE